MKHAHTDHHPKKTPAPKPPATDSTPSVAPKDELLRQAAYFYYQQRGCVGGQELDDWLKAEAEFERLHAAPADADAAAGH